MATAVISSADGSVVGTRLRFRFMAVAAAATMPAVTPTTPSPMILFNIVRPPRDPRSTTGRAAYPVSRHRASASPRRRAGSAPPSAGVGRRPRGRAGPEPRAVGKGKAAVDRVDRRCHVDQFADPRIGEVVEVLEDVDVPGRHREWTLAAVADRAADVVRRERQVVRLGPAREPAHPGEPAEMGHVCLDDVDLAALDERRGVLDRVDPLAGRDRQRGRARTGRGRGVLRRDGLLDPVRGVRLEGCATWAAVSGENRPCISIISPISGPIASRTAATTAIARRRSAADSRTLAAPNGSSFIAR